MASYDIAIVGGGPVGLYAASLLEKDFSVVVLERQSHIGHKACSGLISVNIDRFVSPGEAIEHEVSGAILHSPCSTEVRLAKFKSAAYVLDRKRFDRLLAERIGCPVKTGTAVTGISVDSAGVMLNTTKGAVTSSAAIGCDGAGSIVARHLGQKPKELLAGLIAFTGEKNSSDAVELFFNKDFVGDGFLWKIPRGRRTEYGAMGSNIDFQTLEGFFHLKDFEREAALIPIGPCRTYAERLLLIGDAAGQTKPWSGGGVIFGFTAAKVAANILKKCFRQNDFTAEALSAYEEGWTKAIGREISFGLIVREMLKDLTNSELDTLFREFKGRELSSLDMDFPVFSSLG